VGPRAGLDTEDRGKILCPRRGSNPDRPVVQPVARHYTAWPNPNSRIGSRRKMTRWRQRLVLRIKITLFPLCTRVYVPKLRETQRVHTKQPQKRPHKKTQTLRKLIHEGTKMNHNTNHWKQCAKYRNPLQKLLMLKNRMNKLKRKESGARPILRKPIPTQVHVAVKEPRGTYPS
jgi:hypothetical protein